MLIYTVTLPSIRIVTTLQCIDIEALSFEIVNVNDVGSRIDTIAKFVHSFGLFSFFISFLLHLFLFENGKNVLLNFHKPIQCSRNFIKVNNTTNFFCDIQCSQVYNICLGLFFMKMLVQCIIIFCLTCSSASFLA